MRHWLIRIVIFGFLGVIINIAVAWGCSLWAPDPDPFWFMRRAGFWVYPESFFVRGSWPCSVPPDWPSQADLYEDRNYALTKIEARLIIPEENSDYNWVSIRFCCVSLFKSGFPLRAVSSTIVIDSETGASRTDILERLTE